MKQHFKKRLNRFKSTALVVFCIIGASLSTSYAQTPPGMFVRAASDAKPDDWLEVWGNVRMWAGVSSMDEDYDPGSYGPHPKSGDKSKSDSDTSIGFAGSGGTDFGIRAKKGKLSLEGNMIATYTGQKGYKVDRPVSVAARYDFDKDFFLHFGSGYDMHMAYKGTDCLVFKMPDNEGFLNYALSTPGQIVDIYYKGFNFGIMASSYPMGYSEQTTDYSLPRMIASYSTKFPQQFGILLMYQEIKIDQPYLYKNGDVVEYDADGNGYINSSESRSVGHDVENYNDGESVKSYGIEGIANYLIGPLFLHGTVFYAVNPFDAGWLAVSSGSIQTDSAADTFDIFSPTGSGQPSSKLENTTVVGGNFAVAYRMGDIEPAAGIAYRSVSNSYWDKDDASMSYFIRASYYLDRFTTISPGIIVTDEMENSSGNNEGTYTRVGVLFEAKI